LLENYFFLGGSVYLKATCPSSQGRVEIQFRKEPEVKSHAWVALGFVCWSALALGQEMKKKQSKNVVGFSTGLVVGLVDYSMYIGDPVEKHFDRKTGWLVAAHYYRKLTPCVWAGAVTEVESITGERGSVSETGLFSSIGLGFLARYPDAMLSVHAGGSFQVGLASSDDWDSLVGIGYGLFVGPALSWQDLSVALYFQPVFQWLSGDLPEDITITDPRIRLQVYYQF
jgi:hypothetical protein